LKPLNPFRYGIKEISKVPEKEDPEANMKKKTGSPKDLI
jgi:hypothetical protein